MVKLRDLGVYMRKETGVLVTEAPTDVTDDMFFFFGNVEMRLLTTRVVIDNDLV